MLLFPLLLRSDQVEEVVELVAKVFWLSKLVASSRKTKFPLEEEELEEELDELELLLPELLELEEELEEELDELELLLEEELLVEGIHFANLCSPVECIWQIGSPLRRQ